MGKMGGDVGKISHLFLIGLSGALSLSSVAEASTCATCAKEIELSKSEVQCVIDRVNKQLSSSLDPIVVATNGCGAAVRDGTRSEAVRQSRQSKKTNGSRAATPYLLTKADAQCLVRKLKQADASVRELRIDLNTCK
jgi:hypothetical protein